MAACGTARMREDFIGATAINRMARFYIDPRDNRTPADYYDLIGDDNGVFGCMGLLACDNVCPKQLPLQDQLGIMRRMVSAESGARDSAGIPAQKAPGLRLRSHTGITTGRPPLRGGLSVMTNPASRALRRHRRQNRRAEIRQKEACHADT